MNRFTVLLLVGILALSSVASYQPECTNYPGKPYLNATIFFHDIRNYEQNSTWYLTHGLIQDLPYGIHELEVCLIIKPLLLSPIAIQNYTVILPREGQIHYIEAITILNDGDSKFVTQMREIDQHEKPLTKFVPIIQTVIDTDYENYAVGYFCVERTDGLMGGNMVILGRSPNPDKIHPDVNNVLNRFGLKLSDFASTKEVHCPEVPQY
ncbi:hypothetical protein O3M35_000764 [Rhynocoris fuscipes]|uniref:Uncharacterized protein n=1 Tax=Rhynocoris fuscipes TaxID=488301 RepID=A0AAW1DMW8_9HEMI